MLSAPPPISNLQVYEGMVKQLEVLPAAIQQQQQLLAADPTAVLPPLEPAGGPIAELPADQAALVWIQYMRFSRRSESVKESRRVRQTNMYTSCHHLANMAAVQLLAPQSMGYRIILDGLIWPCSTLRYESLWMCGCISAACSCTVIASPAVQSPVAVVLLLLMLQLFIRAKKTPRCPWQVFVASALMEWRHAREKDVARKIFEKGLEVAEFATTPEYVLAYAAFLCGESAPGFCQPFQH